MNLETICYSIAGACFAIIGLKALIEEFVISYRIKQISKRKRKIIKSIRDGKPPLNDGQLYFPWVSRDPSYIFSLYNRKYRKYREINLSSSC